VDQYDLSTRAVAAPPFAAELAFAHELADVAATVSTGFVGDLDVRHKPDATPVTQVDLAIERALFDEVAMRYPDDAFLGEESGQVGMGERTWVVDPIDGTKNLVDGIQLWATMIALLVDGEPVLGVVDAPGLGERYDAVRGGGARLGGEPVHTSAIASLDEAFVLHSGMEEWARGPHWDGLVAVATTARRTRGLSDFWGHVLVARGAADALLEHEPSGVWDWAALSVIVTEAGGRMSTLDGEPVRPGCTLLTTNGHLHDQVVRLLRDERG